MRVNTWKDSVKIVRHYPVTGVGANAFRMIFPQYRNASTRKSFTHVENEYLQLPAELGIIGTLAALLFAGVAVIKWLRYRRDGGTRALEETAVIGINQKNGRVTGVVTERGQIEAEIVVNSAGLWGRELGKLAGVNVPLQAAEHYYLLTEPVDGAHPDLPIIEDFGRYAYFREEVGGLLVGFFEPVAAPWGVNGIPKDFSFGEIQPDWDRMMPYIEIAMERVPILKNAGIHKLIIV